MVGGGGGGCHLHVRQRDVRERLEAQGARRAAGGVGGVGVGRAQLGVHDHHLPERGLLRG